MDEYIKREAAIERLKKNLYASNPDSFSYLCFQDAINSVQEIPAADVEPVRHGRWVKDGEVVVCSECGEEHAWDEYRATYCEDCGAKMDEEEDHGN